MKRLTLRDLEITAEKMVPEWWNSLTPEEQRACRPDVVKLCKEVLGQNDKTVVLRCLQHNKVRLSAPCHGVLAHYGQI